MENNQNQMGNSQSDQGEGNGDSEMGMELGYCIYHGYVDTFFTDENGNKFHNHLVSVDDAIECYSEFTSCEPPTLTEEDWESIFETEGTL